MDLIIIAGTHAAACTGLRHQILAVADRLREQGVHVPTTYDADARTWHNLAWELEGTADFRAERGRLADVVKEAKRSGARQLLLMSEEFETAAMQHHGVDRLASLAKDLGGRATVLLIFRHQLSYLNLVFAYRAVNGTHGTWFEDFARSPTPPRQFDYIDVIGRFEHGRRTAVKPLALSEVAAGNGIEWVLGNAGMTIPRLDAPELVIETAPGRLAVLAGLLAHRIAMHRDPGGDFQTIRDIVQRIEADVVPQLPHGGPFWGWTEGLRAELLPDFTAANERLRRRYGVTLTPDDRPSDATTLHLRDVEPKGIKDLLDHLDAATRLALPDPVSGD